MAVEIKSYNEFLGNMARKIIADTAVDDLRTGSVILTLLEAAAANDFENNAAILNILELLNIDTVKNNDLDARGADLGLTRIQALRAYGFVTISDSSIEKRSTALFPIKPAPIEGQTTLFVADASEFSASGTLVIGRGTPNFEGPIPYSTIIDNGTFYEIQLDTALDNDHLISEAVVDVQGKSDRFIPAQTTVIIPANNQNPEIVYKTLRDAVIPAGEDTVTDVEIVADRAGSFSNAGINTITTFSSLPFDGAAVTNPQTFTSGRDNESDEEYRNRIKAYSDTLARGTKAAILATIIGVSDAEESKQVISAKVTEPVETGDNSIIYIDDGTGFEPSFDGQGVDQLIKGATGKEEFLQLANFPLPRPQAVNIVDGPFSLIDGSKLSVRVDGKEEIVTFVEADFKNISAATAIEVAIVINDPELGAENFRCRLTNNSLGLLLFPKDVQAETIQVTAELTAGEINANDVFKFPTNEFSDLKLYRNTELLRRKEIAAAVETVPFSQWGITASGNLIIEVDNTPAQNQTFIEADFGASSFTNLTLEDWVEVFNQKYAGLTATATLSGTVLLSSNRAGDDAAIKITGGTYLDDMFADLDLDAVGQGSDFDLNRQNGNIRIKTDVDAGDDFSAGLEDTKGNILSTAASLSGEFSLGLDNELRPAQIVFVADASRVTQRSLPLINTTIEIKDKGNDTMRIISSELNGLADIQPGDFIYITNKGDDGDGSGAWVDLASCGLYRVTRKGRHISAGADTDDGTWIEVKNKDIVDSSLATGGAYTVLFPNDFQAFFSDKYPQVWDASVLDTPAVAPIQDVVDSLNSELIGIQASIFKTNFIKVTSTTEENGSIAVPVSVGTAAAVMAAVDGVQVGNPSHVASKTTETDLLTYFKRTNPVATGVFLDRHVYSDWNSAVAVSSAPDSTLYSEEIALSNLLLDEALTHDEILNFIVGNNRTLLRSIREIDTAADPTQGTVRTQFTKPQTELDHIADSDSLGVARPLEISDLDNLVLILDQDSVAKTTDLVMSRTGRVNSGSLQGTTPVTLPPTNTDFSADDVDNEEGVDFGNQQFWGKTLNNTEFKDYAMWFRARNWYATGGAGGGVLIVRNALYGPNGENTKFQIEYPQTALQDPRVLHENFPTQTLATYLFGSGDAYGLSVISPGVSFTVMALGSDVYRYDFSSNIAPPPPNFAGVVAGDVMSILADAGVSSANSGQFSILAIDDTLKTVDIYNPNGVSTTPVGEYEVSTVQATAEVAGVSEQTRIDTTGETGASLDGEYFILQDQNGSVAFWYDTDNSGTSEPAHGAGRSVKISSVLSADTAPTVALKTQSVVNLDTEFTAISAGNLVDVTDNTPGVRAAASAGTTSFTVSQLVAGVDIVTQDGNYFLIHDQNGSVAVWIDVYGATEPLHGADRSVPVVLLPGDSAIAVAGKIAAALDADFEYSASNSSSNTATITDAVIGSRTDITAETTNYVVSIATDGEDAGVETINIPTSFLMYPLTGITAEEIADTLNEESDIVVAAPVEPAANEIKLATREEISVISYGHTVTDEYVGMYDAVNWVRDFQKNFVAPSYEVNPNFTLKTPFVLQGASAYYDMALAPDHEDTELGEKFKLVPRTIDNIKHQLTQKALSQLSIIADVNIANFYNKMQIKSKEFGSDGAVEIVGGRANNIDFSVLGDTQRLVGSPGSPDVMETKISASPIALNKGDHVLMTSVAGASRLSRLSGTDTIDVVKINSEKDYRYNPKNTGFSAATNITIDDVSISEYGYASLGIVWRWTHDEPTSALDDVVEGDLLSPYALTGFAAGNLVNTAGENRVAGFPIVAVDAANKYVDIINPNGVAMTSTPIGATGDLIITPTPILRWNLAHTPLNTKYTITKQNHNNLVKIACVDGDSPRFLDCGVAVDDVIVIEGSTFAAANRGEFRIRGVEQDTLIIENEDAVDEFHTIVPFNATSALVQWTANSDQVTDPGATGAAFTNVNLGDWVKKTEDDDTEYVQVVAIPDANTITLGAPYSGITSGSEGVIFDQLDDVNGGVILRDIDDMQIFEGDSVRVNDQLVIDERTDLNWFDTANSGTFAIISWGTDVTDYRPFLRVLNESGFAEADREMNDYSTGFAILEADANKFTSIRKIQHVAVDSVTDTKRTLFLTPANREYKFTESNRAKIEAIGKMGFELDLVTGIDGYKYYTGLLRTVQRLVDGFEPDIASYPGKKAVGGFIELLPPLPHRVTLSIDVTTNVGINLNEITNEIRNVIIDYVDDLGVGDDVVLSEIIANVMAIRGVGAVTFIDPAPSEESIPISDEEKALISPDDIEIS